MENYSLEKNVHAQVTKTKQVHLFEHENCDDKADV